MKNKYVNITSTSAVIATGEFNCVRYNKISLTLIYTFNKIVFSNTIDIGIKHKSESFLKNQQYQLAINYCQISDIINRKSVMLKSIPASHLIVYNVI